jgi:hypothetical protein
MPTILISAQYQSGDQLSGLYFMQEMIEMSKQQTSLGKPISPALVGFKYKLLAAIRLFL